MEDFQIVYTNGKEFVVEKEDTTNFKIDGVSLDVFQGNRQRINQMTEVEKIKENRFDLVGTITIVMIPLIIFVATFFTTFDTGG